MHAPAQCASTRAKRKLSRSPPPARGRDVIDLYASGESGGESPGVGGGGGGGGGDDDDDDDDDGDEDGVVSLGKMFVLCARICARDCALARPSTHSRGPID